MYSKLDIIKLLALYHTLSVTEALARFDSQLCLDANTDKFLISSCLTDW